MPEYIVKRPEIHLSSMVVSAPNPQAAIEAVEKGEGEEVGLDYQETIERSEREWEVEEATVYGAK